MLLGSGLSVFAQPKASFDKTMHEFGTILWKNPVTATFKITNKGDNPMSPLPAGALLPTGPNLLSCRGKRVKSVLRLMPRLSVVSGKASVFIAMRQTSLFICLFAEK